MKVRSLNYLLVLILALALSACATTPRGKIAQGIGAVMLVNKTATVLLNQDKLSAKDGEKILAASTVAEVTLNNAWTVYRSGDKTKLVDMLNQLTPILAELESQLTRLEQIK
ncbi:MAG: hypothetical protein ACKO0Z_08040 [Betaproteobacteria bacterium]